MEPGRWALPRPATARPGAEYAGRRAMVEVASLHDAVIPADDVGELVRDMIVVAADRVGVPVALVQILGRLSVLAIGAVDRVPVERESNQRRMLARLVRER